MPVNSSHSTIFKIKLLFSLWSIEILCCHFQIVVVVNNWKLLAESKQNRQKIMILRNILVIHYLRIKLGIKISQTVHSFLISLKKSSISHVTSISLSYVSNSSSNCHAVIDEIVGFL